MSDHVFMKHVGTLRNTSTRVLIIFNSLPGKEDHALVTEVDSLPDRIKDPLESLLVTEGQDVDEFYKILSRRLMPDNNKTILNELHEKRFLRPVPSSDIIFNLGQGRTTTLEEVLKEMKKRIIEEADEMSKITNETESNLNQNNAVETTRQVALDNSVEQETTKLDNGNNASMKDETGTAKLENVLIQKLTELAEKMDFLAHEIKKMTNNSASIESPENNESKGG